MTQKRWICTSRPIPWPLLFRDDPRLYLANKALEQCRPDLVIRGQRLPHPFRVVCQHGVCVLVTCEPRSELGSSVSDPSSHYQRLVIVGTIGHGGTFKKFSQLAGKLTISARTQTNHRPKHRIKKGRKCNLDGEDYCEAL